MKVLVTGASGFVGSHVAEQLSQAGHDVRALVRKTSNVSFLKALPRVELVYGAIEDAERVADAVEAVDAIVHAAGIVKARDKDEFHRTNVEGTRNVVEAARKRAPRLKRLVHVSSLEAVGPSDDGQPVPPHQEKPITAYGRSKLDAERVVRAAKDEMPVVILRPTGVYGPRDVEIFALFKSVARGVLPIHGDGTAPLTLTYATDCARACVCAIDADVPSGNAYFITDGKVYALKEALEEVERAVGKRALMRASVPYSVFKAVALGVETYGRLAKKPVMLTREKINMLQQRWVCTSEHAQKDLGWTPEVMWPEGTRRAVAWYRENGWL